MSDWHSDCYPNNGLFVCFSDADLNNRPIVGYLNHDLKLGAITGNLHSEQVKAHYSDMSFIQIPTVLYLTI